jgi:hypothetical protein
VFASSSYTTFGSFIMSQNNSAGNTQPQFLTREILFDVKASRIHVFDGISHDTAGYILSALMPRYKWSEYYGLPVMTLDDVAAYYSLKVKSIRHELNASSSCLGELIEGGLLVLRDAALDEIRSQFDIDPKTKECLLFPPQALLRLCLFLPALPAVVRTFNVLWDYAVSKKLDETTITDWESTVYRFCTIHCDRIGSDRALADRLKVEAKSLNLYPYVQHFGTQDCLETWFALLAHKGEFPPSRGNYYIRKHQWVDRIAEVCLRQ